MIIIKWTGKAVTKNRRYRIAKVRDGYRLVKTDAYKSWLGEIGYTIKVVATKRYKTLQSVMISSTLSAAADHHNLVDVVLDAIEACGLIVNDRDAGVVISMPCTRHKRGEDDEIWLFIQEGEVTGKNE